MTDHDETEILSDDQIEQGPAHAGDRPWRQRLASSQARQEFITGVRDHWSGADLGDIESTLDDPDRLVSGISEATGLTTKTVEDELDEIVRS